MKLKVGDSYQEEFIITQEMVNKFAELSGDKNPLHLDKEYAAKTRFKKPIVHGLFSIHVGQNLSFKKPLYPDQKYIVNIELVKIIKDKHFGVFKTQIFDTENNLIVDGTGTALHEEKL
jgi:3-hydroxybutyryl-CoA dehydratase